MKRLLTPLMLIALLLGLASCSDNDGKQLLTSVPKDAQGVVMINLQKLIQDVGAKADNNSLELGSQLNELFDSDGANPIDLMKKGGIKLTNVTYFINPDGNMFLTGFVGDKDVFTKFIDENEISNATIIKDRFWFYNSESQKDNVESYMNLAEKKSIASTELASMLLDEDEDITGSLNYDYLMSLNPQLSMANGLSPIEDASCIFFSLEFDNGKIDLEGIPLNRKYQPIKVKENESTLQKISMPTVKMLGGNYDFLLAMGLNSSVSSIIAKQIPLPIPGLNGIDGTLAVAINSTQIQGSGLPTAMMAVKMSSTDAGTQLGEFIKQTLSTGVQVSMKGKTLLVRTGEGLEGPLQVGPRLIDLEGAYFGLIMAPQALKTLLPGYNVPFDGASFIVKPDDKSIKIKLNIYTGKKTNSLITLLKIAEAIKNQK